MFRLLLVLALLVPLPLVAPFVLAEIPETPDVVTDRINQKMSKSKTWRHTAKTVGKYAAPVAAVALLYTIACTVNKELPCPWEVDKGEDEDEEKEDEEKETNRRAHEKKNFRRK